MIWMDSQIGVPLWLVAVFFALVGLIWWAVRTAQKAARSRAASEPHGLILKTDGVHTGEGAEDLDAGDEDTPRRPPKRGLQTVVAAINKAQAKGQHQDLAALYLERASCELFAGDKAAAAEHLRKAIMKALEHDLKAVHAAARLELGDLSKADGDLTTACEHWQMARGLFHELDQKNNIENTDARMKRNGCPTDWVLTDF